MHCMTLVLEFLHSDQNVVDKLDLKVGTKLVTNLPSTSPALNRFPLGQLSVLKVQPPEPPTV